MKLSHPFSDNITSTISAPAKQLIDSLCYDSLTINKTIFEVLINTINEIMNNYDVISTNEILEMIITTIFAKSSFENINILFPDMFKTLNTNTNNNNNILMNICIEFPSLYDLICDRMISIIKSFPFMSPTILFNNYVEYVNDNQHFQLYYRFTVKIEKELINSFDLRLSRLLYLHNYNVMKYCNNDISTIDSRWNMIKNIYNNNNIDEFINNVYIWIENPLLFLEEINISDDKKIIQLWCFLHYFYSQIISYCYNLLYKLKDDENDELMKKIIVIISFMKFPTQKEKQIEYMKYLISFKMNNTEEKLDSGIISPIKNDDSDLKCFLKITQLVVSTKDNENIIKLFDSLNCNKLQQLDCLMFIELISFGNCDTSKNNKDLIIKLYKNEDDL